MIDPPRLRPTRQINPTDDRVLAAAQQVLDAWTVQGPRPDVHRAAQVRLMTDWPRLAQALDVLERVTS